MGWAKYYEDNLEIIYERQAAMNDKFHVNQVQIYNSSRSATKVVVNIINNNSVLVQKPKHFTDRYIICKDCGRKFLFSAKAQEHYAKKGWCPPKRCKSCRDFHNTLYLMVS